MSRESSEYKVAEGGVEELDSGYLELLELASSSSCEAYEESKIRSIFTKYPDLITRRDKDGNTLLMHAVVNQNESFVNCAYWAQDCLDEGEFLRSVKAPNNSDKTLVQCAAENGFSGIVCNLAKLGADISSLGSAIDNADSEGAAPLMYAAGMYATEQDLTLLKQLLDNGADPNIRLPYGETALMIAAAHGFTASVEVLLEAGADPSLKAGADPTLGDIEGKTALDLALECGHSEIVRKLEERVQSSSSHASSSLSLFHNHGAGTVGAAVEESCNTAPRR